MVRRLTRWSFASRSQPDVLLALLVADVVWNVVLPKQWLAAHDERIGVQSGLRPWLLPIKVAAIAGILLGKRFPKFGALTALATAVYFVIATGYHVRAKDNLLGTAPAIVYGGAAARTALAFSHTPSRAAAEDVGRRGHARVP